MNQELHPRVADEPVTIRAIRIDDLERERDFIHRLSPAAKHYRFLGGVSELSAHELRRLCDVAKDLGMASMRDPSDPHQVIYSLTL